MNDDAQAPTTMPAAVESGSGRRQPESYLSEVFGFPGDVHDADVTLFRSFRLCPFRPIHADARRDLSTPHERLPFPEQFAPCTKDSKTNPLGVCSVYAVGKPAITCPVRFTEAGEMMNAARAWSGDVLGLDPAELRSVPEVRLVPAALEVALESAEEEQPGDPDLTVPEVVETSAGNIDYVLAHVDVSQPGSRLLTDYEVNAYAALEVQAVYISGNVREPFTEFMGGEQWTGRNPPRPDWLSSGRKRLVPQLAWKGSILRAWGRPIAVCVQQAFWDEMPYLQKVTTPDEAGAAYRELAWVIIDLEREGRLFRLRHIQTVYSTFNDALTASTRTPAGSDRLVKSTILRKVIEEMTGQKPAQPRKPRGAKKAASPAKGASRRRK